ncbi:MAG TPA: hypothetical protein VF824_18030 [Thermoanaerobaculia bacterium]
MTLPILLLVFTTPLFAKDVYLSIGGQVNNFFTDARILNPSFDKDITVTARYLQNNQDNSGAVPVTLTVRKREMVILDNVVSAVFHAGGIGAVRLTSDDDFIATQRIYANNASKTLGQFVPGLDASSALKKGALIQLKQNGSGGTVGTFRTNMGGVNPNGSVAHVTLKLYDKNNAVVATKQFDFEPFGVLTPQRIDGFFESSADLSDSWISYSSDQPIFLYGSIVDNGSDDPTFIPASQDSGNPPADTPPQQKTVTITAFDFNYTVTSSAPLAAGDKVLFRISARENIHGFQLAGPNGETVIPQIDPLGSQVVERLVTLPAEGTYTMFCTHISCGSGHNSMFKELQVGASSNPGGAPRY